MPNSNRRRKYWIDPDFQGRFLRMLVTIELLVLATGCIFPLLLSFVLFMPGSTQNPNWWFVLGVFLVAAIVQCIFIGYLSVRLSHKICGPIYRIQKNLEAFREGEYPPPIQPRKHDELQDLVWIINDTIEDLHRTRSAANHEVTSTLAEPVTAD